MSNILDNKLIALEDCRQRYKSIKGQAIALSFGAVFIATMPAWVKMPPASRFLLTSLPAVVAALRAYTQSNEMIESYKELDNQKDEYAKLRKVSVGTTQAVFQGQAEQIVQAMFAPPPPPQQQQEQPAWIREAIAINAVFRDAGIEVGVRQKIIDERGDRFLLVKGRGVKIDAIKSFVRNHRDEFLVAVGLVNASVAVEALGLYLESGKEKRIAASTEDTIEVPSQEVDDAPYVAPDEGLLLDGSEEVCTEVRIVTQAQPKPVTASTQEKTIELENRTFEKFLKSPHNWIAGKTNSGKTFLLLRLLFDWVRANPDGQVLVCDRNFGKPDRVTGEIFLWNGLDEKLIHSRDEAIVAQLESQKQAMEDDIKLFEDYARRKSQALRFGMAFNETPPQKRKVLIVITEWNALADATKEGKTLDTSPVVQAVRPILQQGNGYGYKVIMDGQSIAVGESGISEALRQQLSVCMVGDNCVTSKEVRAFGNDTEQLVNACATIRRQGKRACIIQLGEGNPIATYVPEMPYIRDWRFDSQPSEAIADPWQSQESSDKEDDEAIDEGMAKKSEGRFSKAYLDFLKSPEWQAKRQQVLSRDGHRCRMCSKTPQQGAILQVDHSTYPDRDLPYNEAIEAFRNQSIDDMLALCKECHSYRTRKSRATKARQAKVIRINRK